MKKSFHSGHEIYYKNLAWYYVDNNLPVAGNERKCGYCGRQNTAGGHDGCLGMLKGVKNACCGHGKNENMYIQFENGFEIRENKF
jgi:hypothetical protein